MGKKGQKCTYDLPDREPGVQESPLNAPHRSKLTSQHSKRCDLMARASFGNATLGLIVTLGLSIVPPHPDQTP